MDLWDLTKMLFRRWYVFAPVLLVSLGVVFVVAQNVQPDYSAKGHLQLIPPPERPDTKDGPAARPNNRWLDLGFPALGSAVILQAQSETVLSELTEAGYTDNFTVTMEYGTTYLTIEAIGTSREQATTTVQELMRVLDGLVTRLQEQFAAPELDQITTLPLDNGDKVEAVTSKKKRVAVVAIGLALMLSVGASIGLDALLRMRKRRAAKGEGDGADEPAVSATAKVGAELPPPPVAAAAVPIPPVPSQPPGESTVVIRPPGSVIRSENTSHVERPSRHEETVRIYPGQVPKQPVAADDSAIRRGEAARAEILARAEGSGHKVGTPHTNGAHTNGAHANGVEHKGEANGHANGSANGKANGKANGRNGVAVSQAPRPDGAESIDSTVFLPAPRLPRGNPEDKG